MEMSAGDWRAALVSLWKSVQDDNVGLVAAGVAFFGLLATFPAITALMAVAGLVYEPAELVTTLAGFSALAPPDVSDILLDQADAVAGGQESGLTLGVVFGLSLALWSASVGTRSLVQGLNVAYNVREDRNFFKLRALTLLMTVCAILGLILTASMIVAVPVVLSFLAVSPILRYAIQVLSYLPLAGMFIGGVLVCYQIGPTGGPRRWRDHLPGAIASLVLWLAVSIGFSVYVQNFASYNETFGSIAGVIVLLMWMWLSAYIVLAGAEFNGAIALQCDIPFQAGAEGKEGPPRDLRPRTRGPPACRVTRHRKGRRRPRSTTSSRRRAGRRAIRSPSGLTASSSYC